MDLTDLLINAHGSDGLRSVGEQFGLSERETALAMEQLAPVIAAGVRRNVSSPQGMHSLLEALQRGDHERFLDDPNAIRYENAADQGNRILGHIFGSKDTSREIAMQIGNTTGIGSSILKKLLPIIASMVLGQLTKKMTRPSAQQHPSPGGLGDILADILGGNRNPQPRPQSPGGLGDILGDILGTGTRQQQPTQREQYQPEPQRRSPGGLDDLLRDLMGGAQQPTRRTQRMPEEPDFEYDERGFENGRNQLDDMLGRNTETGNAADDLLNSVERHLGRR